MPVLDVHAEKNVMCKFFCICCQSLTLLLSAIYLQVKLSEIVKLHLTNKHES